MYRLVSGPLSRDASLYCAEVKRLTYQRAAPLYRLALLIQRPTEQRPMSAEPTRLPADTLAELEKKKKLKGRTKRRRDRTLEEDRSEGLDGLLVILLAVNSLLV